MVGTIGSVRYWLARRAVSSVVAEEKTQERELFAEACSKDIKKVLAHSQQLRKGKLVSAQAQYGREGELLIETGAIIVQF